MPSALARDAFFVFMLIQFLRAIPRDMEAMSVLALTPALVVFFLAQKYFIEGISTGGVKG